MMLDPVDPKNCIKIAGSFERITELLARYLYANSQTENKSNVNDKKQVNEAENTSYNNDNSKTIIRVNKINLF